MMFARGGDPCPPGPYRRYKPYLQNMFLGLCCYCEVKDDFFNTTDVFGVEHFRPKKLFKDLENEWSNLYYCCNECNRYKGAVWPSEEMQRAQIRLVDPCAEDLYGGHLVFGDVEKLEAATVPGRFMLELIQLNRPSCRWYRQRKASIANRLERLKVLVQEAGLAPEWRDAIANELAEVSEEWIRMFQPRKGLGAGS